MDACSSVYTILDHVVGQKWPENAKTWPSGAPPASDINFRTNIVKLRLIPNKNGMLEAQSGASRTKTGWDAKTPLCT